MVDKRLAARVTIDANDLIYAYEASRDYDPAPHLEKIKARVLAINAADDERLLWVMYGRRPRCKRNLTISEAFGCGHVFGL